MYSSRPNCSASICADLETLCRSIQRTLSFFTPPLRIWFNNCSATSPLVVTLCFPLQRWIFAGVWRGAEGIKASELIGSRIPLEPHSFPRFIVSRVRARSLSNACLECPGCTCRNHTILGGKLSALTQPRTERANLKRHSFRRN